MFMTISSETHRGARRNGFQPSSVFLLRLTPQAGTRGRTAMSSRATSAHRPQKPRRRQIDLRDPSNRAATDHELLANLLAYSQGRRVG